MSDNVLNPIPSKEWSYEKARHLLNRAGFGVPNVRVGQLARLSPRKAVRSLLAFDEIPVAFEDPRGFLPPADWLEFRKELRGLPEEERRKAYQERRREERRAVEVLKAWWFKRMCETPRPLEEKLALFWHGHFATSAQKVLSAHAAWQLNDVFREHAAGNFKSLTLAVAQSPSMIRYLDAHRNVKGRPNENWARELMELFTLGPGNYTEEDIKESARAFTGWSVSPRQEFVYRKGRHDAGTKTFLGRTGKLDGWDVIDRIFEQPATAEFIARKLWTYFAYEEPEAEIVRGLAAELREYDYELTPMLERLFLSRAFYSKRSMGNQIKSPAQYVVQLAHDLKLDPVPYPALARAARQLGQDLFHPPNVSGWDGGRAWINANTLLIRYNLPKALVQASADHDAEMGSQDSMMAMMEGGMTGMNQGERIRGRFRRHMESLPREERRAVQQRLKAAGSGRARREMVESILRDRPLKGAWDPWTLVEGMEIETLAAELEQRYLSRSLSEEQREVLAETLGSTKSAKPSRERLTAALHLLFSTAEYQLA